MEGIDQLKVNSAVNSWVIAESYQRILKAKFRKGRDRRKNTRIWLQAEQTGIHVESRFELENDRQNFSIDVKCETVR